KWLFGRLIPPPVSQTHPLADEFRCFCKSVALKVKIHHVSLMDARATDLSRGPDQDTAPGASLGGVGWRAARGVPSIAALFGSVATAGGGSFFRKLLASLAPGYLVAVGYMDPGNWATSLAGGSKFGYALLSVAMLSNVMAIVLQSLSARLGVGAGR